MKNIINNNFLGKNYLAADFNYNVFDFKKISLRREKMSKSNRFKVIHRIGILIRDVFEYLLTEPIDEKKEEYYRKLQTKYYYLDI
jgi:hypothetical protein